MSQDESNQASGKDITKLNNLNMKREFKLWEMSQRSRRNLIWAFCIGLTVWISGSGQGSTYAFFEEQITTNPSYFSTADHFEEKPEAQIPLNTQTDQSQSGEEQSTQNETEESSGEVNNKTSEEITGAKQQTGIPTEPQYPETNQDNSNSNEIIDGGINPSTETEDTFNLSNELGRIGGLTVESEVFRPTQSAEQNDNQLFPPNEVKGINSQSVKDDIWYRVRKEWGDSKSQLGAFKSLSLAKAEAAKNKGFKVYNENGQVVYSSKPE